MFDAKPVVRLSTFLYETIILAFMLLKHPALAGKIMQKNLDRKAFGVAVRRLREEGASSVFPIGTFLSDY